MAILNRILNIVIFLVAIAALVFGYLLSSHRQAARERGDKYAQALSDVVAAQDAGSGTNTQATVSVDNLKWDKFEKEPSLVDKAVTDAVSQAKSTIAQRDALAKGIADVGGTFGLTVPEDDLKDKSSYEENIASIQGRLQKVKDREQVVNDKVALVATRINANVDPEALKSLDAYEPEFENLVKDAGKLSDLSKRLKTVLAQVVEEADPKQDIGFTPELIAEAPADKLNELVTKLQEMREAMAERDELRIVKQKMTETNEALSAQLVAANELVEEYKKRPVEPGPGDDDDDDVPAATPNTFEGSIVSVNYELSYVIIDLGGKDRLPSNIKLSVVRDREFITDIAVTTVYKDYAVADILPDLMEGQVIPGDKVVYFTSN